MKHLNYNVFIEKILELETNFTTIDDDKKAWLYKKLKLEDETKFKIAVNTILETRSDKKFFPLLGEIKKEINQVKSSFTDKPEFSHCDRCGDEGYVFKKVIYPDLSPSKPYELAFYCSCDWGKRNKRRDDYLIKEGIIKPSSMRYRAYKDPEEF